MRAIDSVDAATDPDRKRDEAETAKLQAWIKLWKADPGLEARYPANQDA